MAGNLSTMLTMATTLPASEPFATIVPIRIDLQDWVTTLAVVASSFSIVGSVIIIACYLAYADMRTTSREILAYLSFCDIVSNAMLIWGSAWSSYHHSQVNSSNIQCQVQAVILINIRIAEYLWTCALSFYLFMIIVRQSTWGFGLCPRVIHLACWGTGFVIAPLAYGLDKTGVDLQASNTAQWCILRGADDPKMGGRNEYVKWSFLVGDGWNFLAIVCTLFFYIFIKRSIYLHTKSMRDNVLITQKSLSVVTVVDRKLTWIPIVYFLLHIWSPIRTIIALTSNDNQRSLGMSEKALLALQTFGDCSEGLTNSIIFVLFSPKLRQRLKQVLLGCLYRVCLRCLWRNGTFGRRPSGTNEQVSLLHGTIASTYAQGSTDASRSSLRTRETNIQTQLDQQAASQSYASLSTNTARRSYAI